MRHIRKNSKSAGFLCGTQSHFSGCSLWVCAGRPCSGQINCDRITARALQYKRAIRVSYDRFECNCTERLLNSLLVHDYQSFWHEWKNHYGSHDNSTALISECSNDTDICEGFAASFRQNFKNCDDCTPLKEQFLENLGKYVHNDKCLNAIVFTTADVDNAMHGVKCNKAAGPDNLTVEHLQNAEDRVPFLLSKLFNCHIVHGFVLHEFGISVIVPVSKGVASKLSVFEGCVFD